MDWFASYPADYRNDTWHLTLSEHGAYKLLIDHYMMYENALPDNDTALASIIGVSVESWLEVKDTVLKFFQKRNGKLFHKRCDGELKTAFKMRKDGAKRAAKYRKGKGKSTVESNVSVTRDKRVSNASTGQDTTGHNNTKKEAANKKFEDSFADFWKICPHPVDKKETKEVYRTLLKTVEPDIIYSGMERYAQSVSGTEKKYIKHPKRWLRAAGWENEYEAPAKQLSDAEQKRILAESMSKYERTST